MPLNTVHLENMLALVPKGGCIVPPMPAWYDNSESIEDIINHIVTRVLDQFDLDLPQAKCWQGLVHVDVRD
ncbi:MAG: putative UbiX-like flavin prenyltransferase [Candidatus Celerinatantimonas neptuna]|nr:MAG: putative UbiX-like flavin prenyltransferase [Candidatus Celerinatantimonas neptuna]